MHSLYFICEGKFYARTHVKITRQWKLTFKLILLHWIVIYPIVSAFQRLKLGPGFYSVY